jgi:hypothetical protein
MQAVALPATACMVMGYISFVNKLNEVLALKKRGQAPVSQQFMGHWCLPPKLSESKFV